MSTDAVYGKARYILDNIRERVGGDIRVTVSGVPYLYVDGHSVCYFARGRYLRAFDGARCARATFRQWPDVVRFILSGRPHKSVEELVDLYRMGRNEEVLALLRHQQMIGDGESVPQAMERLSGGAKKSVASNPSASCSISATPGR